MKEPNNPAARLHALLRAGQAIKKNQPASKAWAEILAVPEIDNSLLLRRVGHVMALPSKIKESMSYIEDLDQNIYLRWLSRVEKSFGLLNFDMQWSQFIERFDGEIMYGIEICADRLAREFPEKIANQQLLDNLLLHVNDMIQEIERGDLIENIWSYIYEHLLLIKEAIEDYKILGIKPLESVLEKVVGSVVIDPSIYRRSQSTPKTKGFWDIMGKLALVVTVTVGSIQIGQEIVALLPAPEFERTVEAGSNHTDEVENDDAHGHNET